jgi:hypothetical protein
MGGQLQFFRLKLIRASSVESIKTYTCLCPHTESNLLVLSGPLVHPPNPHGSVNYIAAKVLFPACFEGSSARIIDFCFNYLLAIRCSHDDREFLPLCRMVRDMNRMGLNDDWEMCRMENKETAELFIHTVFYLARVISRLDPPVSSGYPSLHHCCNPLRVAQARTASAFRQPLEAG